VARLELPPLPPTEPGWPSFQVWWQQVKEAIERNDLIQQNVIDALDTGITAPGGMADQLAILGSFTIPTMILTATDVGSSVTISIPSHIRRYSNAVQIALTGGTITGLAFGTKYGVYYDDESRADAAPEYHATPYLQEAQHNWAIGRHYCGTVTTPADGAGPTTGGCPPAGSGYTAGASAQVIP
jgi:hypothetical protein